MRKTHPIQLCLGLGFVIRFMACLTVGRGERIEMRAQLRVAIAHRNQHRIREVIDMNLRSRVPVARRSVHLDECHNVMSWTDDSRHQILQMTRIDISVKLLPSVDRVCASVSPITSRRKANPGGRAKVELSLTNQPLEKCPGSRTNWRSFLESNGGMNYNCFRSANVHLFALSPHARTHRREVVVKNCALFASAWAITLSSVVPVLAGDPTPVWSDEFEGTSLNTSDWEYMIGNGHAYGVPGWGNEELEYYTDRPQNIFVSGGMLNIVALEESYSGFNYTSARIRTLNNQDFRYGRFEARMKMPKTQGVWPAFWMLPTNSPYGGWAASGEIDIMETKNDATIIGGALHFGGPWPENTYLVDFYSPGTDFSADFHVFRVDWEPDSIRWYVDDVLYHAESSNNWYSTAALQNNRAPFDTPFHILLNVAVGGNYPGPPDGSSVFSPSTTTLQVDWVRVYEYAEPEPGEQSPFLGSPQAIPGRVEAEAYDIGGPQVAYVDCDVQNNGGAYRPGESVDIEPSTEGGFNVGWMCASEWLEYTVDVAQAGNYRIEARMASEQSGGMFRLEFDGVDKTGAIGAQNTGAWQNWTSVFATAQLDAGEQIMRFANGSGAGEYNLSYFDFELLSPADFDLDGDVDVVDHQKFTSCLAGPGVVVAPIGCSSTDFEAADLDHDSDVDLDDAAAFDLAR